MCDRGCLAVVRGDRQLETEHHAEHEIPLLLAKEHRLAYATPRGNKICLPLYFYLLGLVTEALDESLYAIDQLSNEDNGCVWLECAQ